MLNAIRIVNTESVLLIPVRQWNSSAQSEIAIVKSAATAATKPTYKYIDTELIRSNVCSWKAREANPIGP